VDSSSIIDVFKHYEPNTFIGLWKDIDKLIKAGRFISHMEVFGELSRGGTNPDADWLKAHKELFVEHTVREAEIIRDLQKRFKLRTNYRKVLVASEKADYHADPWLIALATEAQEARKQKTINSPKPKKYFIVTEDSGITEFATKELDLSCIKKNELFKKEGWTYP
jgi:hypothetical protein